MTQPATSTMNRGSQPMNGVSSCPTGVTRAEDGLADEESFRRIIRGTGGIFPLLQHLLTPIGRVLEKNYLDPVALPVNETARGALPSRPHGVLSQTTKNKVYTT